MSDETNPIGLHVAPCCGSCVHQRRIGNYDDTSVDTYCIVQGIPTADYHLCPLYTADPSCTSGDRTIQSERHWFEVERKNFLARETAQQQPDQIDEWWEDFYRRNPWARKEQG